MIRIPSLYSIWKSTRLVVGRFTIPFLISVFAVIVWWVAIDQPAHVQPHYYKLLALCNSAFCITLSIDLYRESAAIRPLWNGVLKLLTLALCGFLFFILEPEWKETDVYRILLFILAAHLLVSFAPFTGQRHTHSFWQYNKFLFLRFLITGLYSAVLYVGLAIALLCVEQLFNLNVNGDIYYRIFAVIAAGFNTVFFLAGFPPDIKAFEEDTHYPKGLKIFTQYVLIPLLTLYLGILLVYEVKIIWQQQLPKGTVSILILGYAVLGILSYLLVYPIRIRKGNEWIKTFAKLFFILMIPLLVLLFVAVWARIADYAMTEPRYFLVVLALWLSAITIYFIAARAPSIQWIPISLCVVALMATFGPQSAASVARTSQLNRFTKLQPLHADTAQYEKAAIVRYMVNNHGLASLQALTKKDLNALQDSIRMRNDSSRYAAYAIKRTLTDTAFSIFNVKPKFQNDYTPYLNLVVEEQVMPIQDYEYMVELSSYTPMEPDSTLRGPVEVAHKSDKRWITIKIGKEDSIRFDMETFRDTLRQRVKRENDATRRNGSGIRIPQQDFRWTGSTDRYDVAILFKSLQLPESKTEENDPLNSNYTAVLLFRRKAVR